MLYINYTCNKCDWTGNFHPCDMPNLWHERYNNYKYQKCDGQIIKGSEVDCSCKFELPEILISKNEGGPMIVDKTIVEKESGWSMPDYAKMFKKYINTLESRAAYTVYEKYKRKFNIDLNSLIRWTIQYSDSRFDNNKKINLDILIQESSKHVKNIEIYEK